MIAIIYIVTLAAAIPPSDFDDPDKNFFVDEFSGTRLDSVWNFIDPRDDTDINFSGRALIMYVAYGKPHIITPDANTAPRFMQLVEDAPFMIEVKFDSEPSLDVQQQGLIVFQDPDNFLLFDVFIRNAVIFLHAVIYQDARPTFSRTTPIFPGPPYILRIKRNEQTYEFYHSFAGKNFFLFARPRSSMLPRTVGFFAGNNGQKNPRFPCVVDYFINSSPPPPLTFSIQLSTAGPGQAYIFPYQRTYRPGKPVNLIAIPEKGYYFDSWTGDINSTRNPLPLTIDRNYTIQALFAPEPPPDPLPPQLPAVP